MSNPAFIQIQTGDSPHDSVWVDANEVEAVIGSTLLNSVPAQPGPTQLRSRSGGNYQVNQPAAQVITVVMQARADAQAPAPQKRASRATPAKKASPVKAVPNRAARRRSK